MIKLQSKSFPRRAIMKEKAMLKKMEKEERKEEKRSRCCQITTENPPMKMISLTKEKEKREEKERRKRKTRILKSQ